jgi:hypothetical protein
VFDSGPPMMCQTVKVNEHNRVDFCLVFAAQLPVVHFIICLFTSLFRSFINFIANISFTTSPFIVYIAHKLMFSDDIPKTIQPDDSLVAWNNGLAMFGLYFFTMNINELR